MQQVNALLRYYLVRRFCYSTTSGAIRLRDFVCWNTGDFTKAQPNLESPYVAKTRAADLYFPLP